MAAKTIEARLVLSGEDKGASASVAAVVKSVRQLEEVSKVSAPLQRLAKDFQQVEQASKAVNAAMGARSGFSAAEAGLRATQGAAQAATRALEQAKVARAAFDGVKAARGSAEAKEIEAATRAVRDYTVAQRKAEGDVRRATAAVAAQSSALQHAESSAVKFGADLSSLESHQVRLRSATESATGALRTQLRVEDQAARSAAHLAREQAEAARHMRQHGAIGLAAGAAAGAVSAHSVVHGTVDGLKAGARLQHETVALKNAGRTPEEFAQIERASRETVKAVPTATFEENLKVINETVSAFGSLDHALEHLTFMQKASEPVNAAAGGKITDNAGEMGNKMARFAEERGSAGDGHRFERETEGLVRAMVFSGGNFNPHEAINFAQQAKSSLRGYDEEFLTTIMPSIVGTMKGERAGTAANAFNNVINGKVNDKSQVIMKAGHATAWRSGAVKDTTLAHENPLKWMETVVLPALKAKGVNVDDDEELSKVFATMFRGNTSNFFANEIGLKSFRARLHKDAALQKQTGSLDDIYNRNLKEDPTEGLKAVKSGLEDLLAAATSPLMAPAAAGLKALAEGLQSIALVAKDHPMMAAGAGGAAVASGLAASGFASYKIATGFGLPSAAAELTVAAKMLQGAAVEKGAAGNAAKALPLAGFGLGGVVVGLGAGAAVAGYATSQELPKIAEKEGPGAIDPATGEHLDTAVPETTPWVRNWITSWFTKPEVADEAGKAIGKGIVDAPLPPRRPAMLDAFKEKADEAGTEAGKTLLQRITEAVGAGIMLPITFGPGGGSSGGGGGLIQKASFGGDGAGLGGMIRKASFGSGGVGSGIGTGGGGGGGISARDMRNINPEFAAHIRASALSQGIDPDIALRIANSEGLRGSNPNRLTPGDYENGKPTSFGPFQLHYGRSGGLGNRYTAETGHHAGDPRYWQEQIDFALRTARKEGWGAWYGRKSAGVGVRDGIGTVKPVPMVRDGEPHLIRGLDGKEGLDLGNGTMKMPDGSIRSITRSGMEIPDMPAGGLGTGTGGRADMQAAADRMHAAAERFENASFHGQIELTGLRRSGVRATSLKIKSGGGMSADLGISEPGAKEDMSDWT
ncbi:hypothetical protein [Methylobacterium sp. GC_Met_3]|uniref:hypothetical protein n=1 Tax=Methylobacterium sp. GC_Met_3 TaxID=2937375 RepID=UPI002269929A|nr:hypothetical protein [Methylobacterium sp. GC_Met_3]